MTRIWPTANLLVVLAVAGAGLGCEEGTTQSLSIGECISPAVAVGATVSCKVIIANTELDCSDPAGFGTCESLRITAPAQVTQAVVDDASVFEVTGFSNDTVELRALAEGNATVEVMAPDSDGKALTATASITAAAPDGMRTKANCLNGRAPEIVALPVDSLQAFTVELLAGASPLATSQVPKVNGGALTEESVAGATVTYRTPTTPTETELTSTDYADFGQTVRVYDVYGVTGVSLVPRSTGPYPPGALLDVDVALRVEDEVACSEMTDRWAKSVTVQTPSVCTLAAGRGTTIRVSDPPLVQIEMLSAGTCSLSAVSDSTGHDTRLTLTVTEPEPEPADS